MGMGGVQRSENEDSLKQETYADISLFYLIIQETLQTPLWVEHNQQIKTNKQTKMASELGLNLACHEEKSLEVDYQVTSYSTKLWSETKSNRASQLTKMLAFYNN